MLEKQAEVEFSRDDRDPGRAGSAQFTLSSYLLIQNPLKRKSPAWTLIGAIPRGNAAMDGLCHRSPKIESTRKTIADCIDRTPPCRVHSTDNHK
jgi:hypothetical protein